ncbi:MAG: hypothetical protein ACI9HI_000013 [Salinirussus sp.]|jgi:hypothetical protein
MFVGHGLLAFAVVASLAARRLPRERALLAGALAGAFATAPDVDMLFAVLGAGQAATVGGAAESFWAATDTLHRSVTHSLVVGGVLAAVLGAWRARQHRVALAGALAGAGGLVGAVWLAGGPRPAAMVGVLGATGMGVALAAERVDFGPWAVAGLAGVGLLSHPFGDLLTGGPPDLLYPLGWQVVAERVMLSPDPTVHLLLAFFVELGVIWLALVVVLRLRDQRVMTVVRPRAAVGVGYAAAVLAVPAPTVEAAPPFVLSVLAVGLVGVPVTRRPQPLPAVTTGLAAVTLAGLAYATGYLLV